MQQNASQLTRRVSVKAVRDGASVTDTARRYGVSRSTLHRWLRAFDPGHPVASLRPDKPGPKTPRWDDATLEFVVELIGDHLIGPPWQPRRVPGNQWGRHRVAVALAERGIIVSEATVGRMLVVARERIAQEQAREARANEVRLRREGRTAARRAARDRERRQLWQERLATALAPGFSGAERIRRVADALASKGWKMQVKDLTPELEALADAYLAARDGHAGKSGEALSAEEKRLRDMHRWVRKLAGEDPAVAGLGAISGGGPNIDHLRVAALNHLVKKFKSDTASSSAEPSSVARGPRLLRG
jgi:transposase